MTQDSKLYSVDTMLAEIRIYFDDKNISKTELTDFLKSKGIFSVVLLPLLGPVLGYIIFSDAVIHFQKTRAEPVSLATHNSTYPKSKERQKIIHNARAQRRFISKNNYDPYGLYENPNYNGILDSFRFSLIDRIEYLLESRIKNFNEEQLSSIWVVLLKDGIKDFLASCDVDSTVIERMASVIQLLINSDTRDLAFAIRLRAIELYLRKKVNSADELGTLEIIYPTTWEEAKAESPNLLKWEDAETLGHSIVDHLWNIETGYGRWTRQPPGLPISSLHDCDPQAHRKLYNWLANTKNELPSDIFISGRHSTIAPVSKEEVTAARRVVRRWERQQQAKGLSVE